MSDNKLIAKINALFDKWSYLVAARGYRLKLRYFDNHLESDGWIGGEYTAMNCKSLWKYQDSTVAINLSVCKELDDKELEWTVVHELVHVLMGECRYDDISMEERACSEIASAIMETSSLNT